MIYAFIVITFLLLVVIEIFTVLFRLTGLSEHRSRFQVISMLTGVGYTTRESESITTNKLRRTLAQVVILLGYTASATLVSIFVNLYTHRISAKETVTIVVYGVVVFFLVQVKFIKTAFDNGIERIANHYLGKEARNKLHTIGHYNDNILAELTLLNDMPLLNKPLSEIGLKSESRIQILNIEHEGKNIPNPLGNHTLQLNDKILVFGNADSIRKTFHTF